MSKVFVKREEATEKHVRDGETLDAFLLRMKTEGLADVDTWEELALYNWGTTEEREVSRALIENIGCSVLDQPVTNTTPLNPTLGLGKGILVPRAWKHDAGLELEKTHTIKIRKRLPAPAVSITELSQWFIPKTQACDIKYVLEGVSVRADKTDFEVSAPKYYEQKYYEGKPAGELLRAKPHTQILKQKHFKEKDPETNPQSPSVAQEITTWTGESEATEGVLKKTGSGDCFINSMCAPYTVQIRYYKDDADQQARLKLNPFFPCWDDSATPVIDKTTLVVEWSIEDPNKKLKAGQLIIWDKGDQPVFRAVLDEKKLGSGKYDLLTEKVPWKEAEIKQDAMPYRVQIQAHSDMNEDNGLALAAMHTQVGVFKYEWVQCIAFDVRPGTKVVPPTSPPTTPPAPAVSTYLGDTVDSVDIDTRCEIMKEAIQVAYANPHVLPDPEVLKILMAPEFFFRGANGAYKLEEISGIVDKLRVETDKFEYADWLFVFGTALGYLKHEQDTGSGIEEQRYDIQVVAVDDADPSFTKIKVQSKICSRIPKTVDAGSGAIQWKVKQAPSAENIVVECTPDTGDLYLLTLNAKGTYAVGAAELLEPITTEVLNVALVQKGCPMTSPCDKDALKQVLIYKEQVSSIDFIGPYSDDINMWFNKGGVGRKIQIHGATDRTVMPTEGSEALLGASPNLITDPKPWTKKPDHIVGSEINLSGAGGGSVFTIDDITFGLEVCLDHGYDRLAKFYNNGAAPGDPKVQILLIPSWGMKIGGGKIACLPEGVIFNVDGGRSSSVCRVYDGIWSCDNHQDVAEAAPGKCPDSPTLCDDEFFYAACHDIPWGRQFNCPVSGCGLPAVQQDLKQIGTAVASLDSDWVPLADNPDYFETKGYISVYEAKRIPDPEVV